MPTENKNMTRRKKTERMKQDTMKRKQEALVKAAFAVKAAVASATSQAFSLQVHNKSFCLTYTTLFETVD